MNHTKPSPCVQNHHLQIIRHRLKAEQINKLLLTKNSYNYFIILNINKKAGLPNWQHFFKRHSTLNIQNSKFCELCPHPIICGLKWASTPYEAGTESRRISREAKPANAKVLPIGRFLQWLRAEPVIYPNAVLMSSRSDFIHRREFHCSRQRTFATTISLSSLLCKAQPKKTNCLCC